MGRTIAVVFPYWEDNHGHYGQHHSFRLFESFIQRVNDICAVVEVEKTGIMMMSAHGPSRYFGGDQIVAEKLFDVCSAMGDIVGVGIADSRFSALAAAHISASHRSALVVFSAETERFISALSTRALIDIGNVDDETVDLLLRLGLRKCGDVLGLGEVALIDRFGVSGRQIFQLVSGGDVHSFAVDNSPSDFSRVCESDTPLTSVRDVASWASQMINDVIEAVSSRGQQCIRVYIHCETEHGESITRIWRESHGFTARAMMQRLSYQLESWYDKEHIGHPDEPETPTSGVVRVFIAPLECRDVMATQAVLWGGHEENTERAARAVSQVLSLSEQVHVSVLRWEGGRDIATVYSRVPVSTVDITSFRESARRAGSLSQQAKTWSGVLPRPWPAWLAPTAGDISLLDDNGCHIGVTGRHELTATPTHLQIGKDNYEVMGIGGPWPVEERWWDPRRARRNVRVQLLVRHRHGETRLFLVMLENNEWKLVARYD